MAISGGGIPSFPVRLRPSGEIEILTFATNRPHELVEQDIERAAGRLLAGEQFNLHCSGSQVAQIMQLLKEQKST